MALVNQPQALKNLIGKNEVLLPEEGTNIKIILSNETYAKPIITKMARELQIDFVVLGGEIDQYRNSVLGSIIINAGDHDQERIQRYLSEHEIQSSKIQYDNEDLNI